MFIFSCVLLRNLSEKCFLQRDFKFLALKLTKNSNNFVNGKVENLTTKQKYKSDYGTINDRKNCDKISRNISFFKEEDFSLQGK